jgi:hypothetical protein
VQADSTPYVGSRRSSTGAANGVGFIMDSAHPADTTFSPSRPQIRNHARDSDAAALAGSSAKAAGVQQPCAMLLQREPRYLEAQLTCTSLCYTTKHHAQVVWVAHSAFTIGPGTYFIRRYRYKCYHSHS